MGKLPSLSEVLTALGRAHTIELERLYKRAIAVVAGQVSTAKESCITLKSLVMNEMYFGVN